MSTRTPAIMIHGVCDHGALVNVIYRRLWSLVPIWWPYGRNML